MNIKPHVLLLALAAMCMAAVAWAADAPKTAPAPSSHTTHVVQAGQDDDGPMSGELGDADDPDIDIDSVDVDGGTDGGGADGGRHVIVRRFGRGAGAGGGEGCCAMCRRMGGRGMGARMGRGIGAGQGMLAHVAQAVGLSDAQREKLADIHERQMRRDIQARADIQIARLDLRKALTSVQPSASAIDMQIDRVAKLRVEMARSHVTSLLEARALLTPEQRRQMRELRQRGPGAGMPGMGPGMGMGPGGMGGRGMVRGRQPMPGRVERDTLMGR